ncbi:MAG: acyl-CoA thioesterase, partial [Anaerovibrio sp.]|nr:acyl-CoA thioesterase [Anaerovibrio sp.]
AKFDDELIIETTPEALTKAKMAFTYRILRASDDTLLVTGRTQNVFTSMDTGKIIRLPETYYNKLKAMLD